MKITLVKKVEQITEVEVTFPLYFSLFDRFDTGGGYKRAMRIEENGETLTVTERFNRSEGVDSYEITRGKIRLSEIGGYLYSDLWEKAIWEDYIVLQNNARLFLETFPTE